MLKEWIKSSVKRVVKLPESVDSENAKSSYEKWVLECRLPKTQKSQVKVIPITRIVYIGRKPTRFLVFCHLYVW